MKRGLSAKACYLFDACPKATHLPSANVFSPCNAAFQIILICSFEAVEVWDSYMHQSALNSAGLEAASVCALNLLQKLQAGRRTSSLYASCPLPRVRAPRSLWRAGEGLPSSACLLPCSSRCAERLMGRMEHHAPATGCVAPPPAHDDIDLETVHGLFLHRFN